MSEESVAEPRHFGYYFRQRRQERGLSLRDIENATSIRCIYLDGIEEGKISSMLSPVYAKGFVRQYAVFLGLDGDRFIQEYGHLFNKDEQHHDVYGIGTLEPRNYAGQALKVPGFVWLLSIVLLLVVLYVFLVFAEII